MSKLTHLDAMGNAHMVDVAEKDVTPRSATARARVLILPETLALIASGNVRFSPKRPFSPYQPNVRFAPKAAIQPMPGVLGETAFDPRLPAFNSIALNFQRQAVGRDRRAKPEAVSAHAGNPE